MRSIYLIIALIYLITIFGCSQDVERENPLDVQNQRTSGVVTNVKAKAGDSQVLISWPNLGFEGIEEFKIYRAYRTPENFKYIESIKAGVPKEIPVYSFLDKGSPDEPLKNDGDNIYYYRITYIDKDGVETPDPVNPINLQKGWFNVNLIPSEAPPVPNVKVMEDTDLQVRLVWGGYSKIAPDDLAGFKIYAAPKAEKGQEQAPLKLVYTIDDPRVEFYVDGNDYAANKINFRKDGETKLYKIVAFDKVGVESDTPILQGTCPNLPPSPPAQVKATFALGLNTYNVRLEWRRNLE
ncbi:hypothetical protein FJZ33_10410, partial [Candidatus Poribacteria bacterium]|nr:hypothetical protein [Candidatus Poribacteria bacterium]